MLALGPGDCRVGGHSIAACTLRLVHGRVGGLCNVVKGLPVVGEQGNSDGGAQAGGSRSRHGRDGRLHVFGDSHGPGDVTVAQHQQELVTAVPDGGVSGPDGGDE